MLIVGKRFKGVNTGIAKTSDHVFIFFERRQIGLKNQNSQQLARI